MKNKLCDVIRDTMVTGGNWCVYGIHDKVMYLYILTIFNICQFDIFKAKYK